MAEAQGGRRNSSAESLLPDAEPPVDGAVGSILQVDMDVGEEIAQEDSARRKTHDGDTINSTRSLYATDIIYEVENGRTYCGEYYMPIDEAEMERLQLQHQVFLRLSGGVLTSVPLEDPTKILDIGTGKGDWAMAIADMYPEAEVIGTDIAKVQPTAVPPNCFFEIDDAEDESGWTFAEDDFDLIHFRGMSGAFQDWNHMYAEVLSHLKPGGWIEILDFDEHKGMLSRFDPDSDLVKFFRAIGEASIKSGRPRTVNHMDPERLEAAGFEEVSVIDYDIPFGPWPEDKENKFLGKLFFTTSIASIEALSLRVLTKYAGWNADEVKAMRELVENDLTTFVKDKEKVDGCIVKLKVLRARKPQDESDFGTKLVVDDGE
ncbi:putative methyltransferase-containing protein [Coleophoma cylindrospora]|uniref:Putative methyltransferase-containing protein n=1 Tax=Coleophoma cylindrospora TaxID=1849047 RepID=A0A3D8STE6_9HELO|nr:putative methyltransferase-containing protein [Coleophoma cylindrospora]